MTPAQREPFKAYSTLIAGFLYMIFVGCMNCTGVFATYINSYYQISPDSHIVFDLLPLITILIMFIMPVGSALTLRGLNPKISILVAATVTLTCFCVASFFGPGHFAGFAMFYSIGFAVNSGLVYMVPVHHSWLWFPNNPGLVSGIILGGFGVGSLIYDNVFTHIINPNN